MWTEERGVGEEDIEGRAGSRRGGGGHGGASGG